MAGIGGDVRQEIGILQLCIGRHSVFIQRQDAVDYGRCQSLEFAGEATSSGCRAKVNISKLGHMVSNGTQ